jgi:hypothetical protein
LVGASNADVDRAGVLVTPFANFRGIAVRNGAVRNWHSGVNVQGGDGSLVEGVSANGCLQAGFRLDYSAVVTGCSVFGGIGAIGFDVRGGSVTGCSAHNCATGFGGFLAALENCAARICQTGYQLEGATVRGCVATGCEDYGYRISKSTATDCMAYECGGRGFEAYGSLLVHNIASICGGQGDETDPDRTAFYLASGTVAEGNTAFDNIRGFVVRGNRNVIFRNKAGINVLGNWAIDADNVVAPIINATRNPAPITGDSYAGSFANTDPNANFTH